MAGGKQRPDAWLPSRFRLILMAVTFVVITAGGLWWAAPAGPGLRSSLAPLSLGAVALMALLAIGVIVAEMVRIMVTGRAVGVRIGGLVALDAAVANKLMSWLTPGSVLGEPAAAYMLFRHGIPAGAAAVVAMVKLAFSMICIFGTAAVLLSLGYGPVMPQWIVVPATVSAALSAVMMTALVVGAMASNSVSARVGAWGERHPRFAGVAQFVATATERLSELRSASPGTWLAIIASQVAYHAVFVAVLVVVALALGARPVGETSATAVIYQAFLFVVPTPGASGIGEASAGVFLGDVLPGARAFTAVVVFRAFTYYAHVVFGLVYLPLRGVWRGRGDGI